MNWMETAAQIKRHEGLRLKPYRDTVGKLTIGYGRNLDDVGISDAEADFLFEKDMQRAIDVARRIVRDFDELSDQRQAVMVNMAFNLGPGRLAGFRMMLHAIDLGRIEDAADEMRNSLWATQVGTRADELVQQWTENRWVGPGHEPERV